MLLWWAPNCVHFSFVFGTQQHSYYPHLCLVRVIFSCSVFYLLLGSPTRNEKFLSCIAAGKWVLHKSYLEKALQNSAFPDVRELLAALQSEHWTDHFWACVWNCITLPIINAAVWNWTTVCRYVLQTYVLSCSLMLRNSWNITKTVMSKSLVCLTVGKEVPSSQHYLLHSRSRFYIVHPCV